MSHLSILRAPALLAALSTALVTGVAPAHGQEPARMPLTLGQAVSRAAREAAGVELAGLQVEEAEARVDQARSALLPTLSASAAEMDRTFNLYAMGLTLPTAPGEPPLPAQVGPFNNVDARLHLAQTLFDPAAYLRTRAARQAVGGSTAEQRAASEAAAQRAALAYLRASRAQATLAAREADARLAAELLELAEAQLQAGVGTGIDVTRARTQTVAAQGQVLVASNAAEQAQIELARAVDLDPATRFTLPDSLEAAGLHIALPTRADSAVALALTQRPELRQVESLAQSLATQKRALQAERLPRVDLIADYGASGLHPSDAIATRQVGVQLSLPLFDGLRREARLAEQSARQQEAVLRSGDLKQQITAEVQAALLERASGAEQRSIAQERLRLAEDELAQARERFSNGVAGNLELIQAQGSLNQARDALIGARFTTAAAEARLAGALGEAAEIR